MGGAQRRVGFGHELGVSSAEGGVSCAAAGCVPVEPSEAHGAAFVMKAVFVSGVGVAYEMKAGPVSGVGVVLGCGRSHMVRLELRVESKAC